MMSASRDHLRGSHAGAAAPACVPVSAGTTSHAAASSRMPCNIDCEGINLQSSQQGPKRRKTTRKPLDKQDEQEQHGYTLDRGDIEGPSTLEDVLCWPHFVVCRVLDHATAHGQGAAFKAALQRATSNITITTSYSGMGCAEMVLPMLTDALGSFGVKAQLTPYSATDVDPLPRRMLLAHKPSSKPKHVFKDVLERIPDTVRIKLQNQGEQARAHC